MGQFQPLKNEQPEEDAQAVKWAEVAGLITIQPDGSWLPTAVARTELLKIAQLPETAPADKQDEVGIF